MSSSLSSLVIDLQVNAAGLKSGLDQANAKLEGFGRSLDRVINVASFATFATITKQLATGLADLVMAGAKAADQTGKLAQVAGVSTEEFSRLQYAAKLSGLSGDELAASMSKLNKNLAEAGAGTRDQTALFRALGIQVKDASGHVRGAGAVLGDLAERFAGMKDGASKSALAMEVFGKSGTQLLPFLNEGRDGFAQLAAECDRLGITIKDKTAQAAERFNDNLDKLEMAVQSVGTRVAAELAPALADITGKFLESEGGVAALDGAVTVLSATLRVLASVAVLVGSTFNAAGKQIAAVAVAAIAAAEGDFQGAMGAFDALNQDMVADAKTTSDLLTAIWDRTGKATEKAMPRKKGGDDIFTNTKGVDEQAQAVKSLEKTLAELQARAESFGEGPLAEFEARLKTGDLSLLLEKAGVKADDLREKLRAAFDELDTKRLNAVVDRIDASVGQTKRDVHHDVNRRQLDMEMVGASPRDEANLATAGFDSFDSALDTLAKETMKHTEMIGTAELLRAKGEENGAQAMEASAANAKRAADGAGAAADGFLKLKKLDWEAAQRRIQENLNGLAAIGQRMMNKIGDLGAVINSAIEGFKSGGGVWGAIAAVFIELLSRFERFQELVDIGNGQLSQMIDQLSGAFNNVIDGLRTFMGASGILTSVVMDLLTPIFKELGHLFEGIVPLIMGVASALEVLQPVFDLIGTVLGGIFKAVGYVMRFIGLTIMATMTGLLGVWQGILKMVFEISKAINFGKEDHGLKRMLDENEARMKDMKGKMDNLAATGMTEVADAAANNSEQVGKMGKTAEKTAKAMGKLTEAFTNMPEGWKTGLPSYQAMDAAGAGSFGSLAGAPVTNINITVNGSLVHENQLMDLIRRRSAKDRFRQYGTPVPP